MNGDTLLPHVPNATGADEPAATGRGDLWAALMAQSPDSIFVLDGSGCVVEANEGFCRSLGYAAGEAVGMPLAAFERGSPAGPLEAMLRTRNPGSQPLLARLTRRDGSAFDAEVNVCRTPSGTRLLCLARDVSERRPADERLRASEQQFRSLAEHTPDCIIRYGTDYRRLYANPAALAVAGPLAESLIGQRPSGGAARFHSAPLAFERFLHGVAESRQAGTLETVIYTYDGQARTYSVWAGPELDAQGRVCSVLTIFRDITEQHRTMRALHESRTRLEEAQRMARLGYWEWSPLTGRTWLSTGAAALLGLEGETEFLRGEDDYIAADDRERVHQALDSLVVGLCDEIHLDFRAVGAQGETPLHSVVRAVRDEQGSLQCLSGFSQDMSKFRSYEARLHRSAYYDAVTGLPNRTLFQERLALALVAAVKDAPRLGVLFLDLDRFKVVNDTLGHAAGDALLGDVAQRFREVAGTDRMVARLGGDEFGLLIPELRDGPGLGALAQQLIDALSPCFCIEGREVFIGASVGIAVAPDDGCSVADLLKHADAAMYHAKDSGRNQFQFYAGTMLHRPSQMLTLAAELRHALAAGEFELYYEPQVELKTGRVLGAEALLRWRHPARGLLSPVHFIGIAEDTGLIVPIGEWVLATACQALAHWRARRGADLGMAVNLSPRQFHHNDIVAQVRRALADSGCPPDRLTVEITEGLLLDDAASVRSALEGLDRLGVSIAIDDFGTGYSALGYLKKFPVDTIKIDRSFIQGVATDADTRALVRAMLSIAQDLRLRLIAEGVEEAVQAERLRRMGCRLAQGWLYGRPTLLADLMGLPERLPAVP